MSLILNKKGATIDCLTLTDLPIFKHLPIGKYGRNNKYLVDHFTGHSIIFQNNKKYTDLGLPIDGNYVFDMGNGVIVKKKYETFINENRLRTTLYFDITKKLDGLQNFRIFTLTFNPDVFDLSSLYYKVANGGKKQFYRLTESFDMSAPIDYNITSNSCLGCTDDELIIGDKNREVTIKFNKHICYTAQMLKFEILPNNQYFLRLYNSLYETDETSKIMITDKFKAIFDISEVVKNDK